MEIQIKDNIMREKHKLKRTYEMDSDRVSVLG